MASWGSLTRPYRDSSPNSPLSPLSPSTFPQWLRPSRSRKGTVGHTRLKTFLLAVACLALGWVVTSKLGPSEDAVDTEQTSYDTSSSGVLSDPSGFGTHGVKGKRPGIIGNELEEELAETSKQQHGKEGEPSVSGALAELRNAVSHKIQSWNPYFAKGPKVHDLYNDTSEANGGKNKTSLSLGGETVKEGVNDDERLGARTRIGKMTILFSGNSFWERCIRTHERHDKVQGYRLHVLRQQLMDDVWSKPAYILSNLLREMSKPESERLDWLFWVDADTIILNPNVPIETFLPPPGTEFDDVYLMYSNDWNGLNNGVFPIRVNQWAVRLFSGIVSYRHFRPDEPLQFRDQSAMNSLMQEPEFAKHIVQAPQRWFNAYQGEHNETLQPFQVRRGDLLVHFAGVGDREARMHYWLQRAEQHLDDWEVPVKSTSYPQEARDFWHEQRNLRKGREEKVAETRKNALELITLTEQRMEEYIDRLNDEQKESISAAQVALKKEFEDEKSSFDTTKLQELMDKLVETSAPLTSAVTNSNKVLLQSAHKAIFAGGKDLLDNNFDENNKDSPHNLELASVSNTVASLKVLVMAPEDAWNRHDITKATNAVTEARAKLQEKLDAEAAAKQEVADRAKALADAKMAAEVEAEEWSAKLAGGSFTKAAVKKPGKGHKSHKAHRVGEKLEEVAEDESVPSEAAGVDGTAAKGVDGAVPETIQDLPDDAAADAVDDAVDGAYVEAKSEGPLQPSGVAVAAVTITAPGPVEWVTAFVDAPNETEAPAAEVPDDWTY
ncbi:uncharacterized protein LTR77_002130 [Saxophila tyrrhenica]|uniref:Glycosyltransferase family 34 protein n=1 Tax=Saxophila tyrrhenica TaxID=1690608 RepID=A0AAV9PI79_9PEZI|nr:hypothetical protein LTR77_002130 [Saxophila tyrrhenica]